MKFFNSLGPNPQTVRMFAADKALDLPRQEVDVMSGEHRQPPYSVQNPMMQTPAFETDEGQIIVESTAMALSAQTFRGQLLALGKAKRAQR